MSKIFLIMTFSLKFLKFHGVKSETVLPSTFEKEIFKILRKFSVLFDVRGGQFFIFGEVFL